MKISMRFKVLGAVALAGAFVLSGGPAMAGVSPAAAPSSYTCTGGAIPSGSYANLSVTGVCDVSAGATITVSGT